MIHFDSRSLQDLVILPPGPKSVRIWKVSYLDLRAQRDCEWMKILQVDNS